jgi:hypothetical protein
MLWHLVPIIHIAVKWHRLSNDHTVGAK